MIILNTFFGGLPSFGRQTPDGSDVVSLMILKPFLYGKDPYRMTARRVTGSFGFVIRKPESLDFKSNSYKK